MNKSNHADSDRIADQDFVDSKDVDSQDLSESNPSNSDEDNDDADDHEEDVEDVEEVDRYWPPPLDEEVDLTGLSTSKTISAFTFNNSGTRFAAGGYDCEVRLWDFDALDPRRPQTICSSQPCGQVIIKNLDYTYDDELILVISGSCQAVIMAKDGLVAKQYQCPKGDQYLIDMLKTKGHVQMLADGCWNPKDKSIFITCSNDSTIRIWDLNKLSEQKTVIKTRSPISGLKALPSVCRYSRDALSIAAGCNDGSIMMWDTRRKFITTSACVKNAHLKGSEISGLDFSYGPHKMATRSEDQSCKIWDLRKLKEPLASRSGLDTLYSTTDCSFSPDDRFIITGTSHSRQKPGCLLFLDSNDLFSKHKVEVEGASVVRSRWHPKINHIAYTCSNGSVFMTHDKSRSMGGFIQDTSVTGRGSKRKKYYGQRESSFSNSTSIKKIITPHALPLFRDNQTSSSFAKIRQDPKRSYKPQQPISGNVSQGGRVVPAGSTLSSYIARAIAKPKDDGGMDIRERILRHAEEAEKDPQWFKPTQQQQQPKAAHPKPVELSKLKFKNTFQPCEPQPPEQDHKQP